MRESLQADHQRAELQAVLASELFVKSPNLTKLLTYICQKSWDGEAALLKEYNLATEALGRSPNFDPSASSTIRVEVHRLREKLRKYYDTEGADHSLVITLRAGSYVPQFVLREPNLRISAPQNSSVRHGWAMESGNLLNSAVMEIEEEAPTPNLAETDAGKRPLRERSILVLPRNFGWKGIFLFALIIVLTGVVLTAIENRWFRASTRVGTFSKSPIVSQSDPLGTEPPGVEILAGSHQNYIGRAGNLWLSDRYYSGGSIGVNPTRQIAGAREQVLFHTYRTGEFSYDIPLRLGKYELLLYFAETKYQAGSIGKTGIMGRVFDIQVNGSTVVHFLNVFSDAGGSYRADVRVFKNISPAQDGFLHIRFIASGNGEPFVNAIKIIPSLSGRLWPIRIVVQSASYTDNQGKTWLPDAYFIGGMSNPHPRQITGHLDPGLFVGERYGNFAYAIPVGSGKYGVSLYFSEQYFGPHNPEGHGVGSRLFDVTCNGQVLLKNFDIFKEAGGPNRPIVKSFHGLEANGQGKLVLRFDSKVNYALVNAIEVVDESP